MRYLALLYWDEDRRVTPASPDYGALLDAYAKVNGAFREAGALIDAAPLENSDKAVSLRIRERDVLVTDGPFAETKERLGGFYLLDCATKEEAIHLAALIPAARHGTVEVRPVMTRPPHNPE